MKKVNERLEKAVLDWKSKHSSAQNQLILATEKTLTQEQEIKKKTSAIEKLEKLCRALNVIKPPLKLQNFSQQRKLKETEAARAAYHAEEAAKTAESSSSKALEDQATDSQPQETPPPQENESSAKATNQANALEYLSLPKKNLAEQKNEKITLHSIIPLTVEIFIPEQSCFLVNF